jgi:YbbR domain-containing protein
VDRLFDNEWILRALAVALAVVLWVQASLYFISIGNDSVRNVPLHVVNVPVGFVATDTVRDVEVTVMAPSTLARLMPRDFFATVTPSRHQAGFESVPVVVSVPRGTRLKTVSPDFVRIHLVPTTGRLENIP